MTERVEEAAQPTAALASLFEVFTVFLRLGLTSFGGPVAHLGYFREAFVAKRRGLDERAYADRPPPVRRGLAAAFLLLFFVLLLGLAAFLALQFWKVPPWLVVLLGAAAASALA